MPAQRKLLYFASPLFSDAEKQSNRILASALERWCDVFLPQRDGELIPDLIHKGLSPEDAYKVVFDRDIKAINACDGLIINMDGRAVDEGAAFELGYAYALGKVCVGYSTDARALLPWGQNPMITTPLKQVFSCPELLEKWAKQFAVAKVDARLRLVAN